MRIPLLVAFLSAVTTAAPVSAQSSWQIDVDQDKMTDEPIVNLSTRALNQVHVLYQSYRPSLYVRCNGGELDVFFNVGSPTEDEELEYRFDSGEPGLMFMIRSTDFSSLFVSEYGGGDLDPAGFLRRLIASNQLRVRWTPYAGSPVTADFSLRGVAALAPRLRKAGCDYSEHKSPSEAMGLAGPATGFVEPPPDVSWIGDLTVRVAYPLVCGNGKMAHEFAKSRNLKVEYFASREAALAAGFTAADPCPQGTTP